MRTYLIGFMIGVLVTGGVTFAAYRVGASLERAKIERFEHTTPRPHPAGPEGNLSREYATTQRFGLTLAIADTNTEQTTATSQFLKYEIHLARLEALLGSTDGENKDHWEGLLITQPTVELLSLRGGGSVAEIAKTELVAGAYQAIRLTIGAIRAVRPGGERVLIPHAGVQTIEIRRDFDWTTPGQDMQLVLDVDSLASVTGDEGSETFTLVVRRLLENDREL